MPELSAPNPPRIALIDLARGTALVAMIVYHLAWDLSFLGLIEADISGEPAWVLFARVIAASFLALAGISLVLAHGQGLDRPAFLRRLVQVAIAALAVTLATWLVMPKTFVFFGILHAIALSSLLALPFLRLPAPALLGAAAAVLALPAFASFESFTAPWLVWLGLGKEAPASSDFVPLFPWFGCLLAGMALARLFDFSRLAGVRLTRPAELLARAGRRSLLVYLLHQPILLGALWPAAFVLQPRPDAQAAGFVAACESECRASGGRPGRCRPLCRCAVAQLRAEGLWAGVLADTLNPESRERLAAISRRCADAAANPP